MLSCRLTDEQIEFQKLAREIAAKEIRSKTASLDSPLVNGYPFEVLSILLDSGLINTALPEACGGLELNLLEQCIIAEELSWGDNGLWGSIEGSQYAQSLLLAGGSIKQKETYLSPLMQEASLAGYALKPTHKGTKVFFYQDGQDFFLSSKNLLVVNGGFADFYVLAAVEDRRGDLKGKDKEEKLTLFVVKKNADGLRFSQALDTFGRKSMPLAYATLEDVLIPQENVLGSVGEGQKLLAQTAIANMALAASAFNGLARASLEHAVQYAKERTTFGVAIGQHQGLAFMLADMAKDIECSRLLTYQAAQLFDQKFLAYSETVSALAFAKEMAMKVAIDAVQIFGGYGFSREYPVEKLMRDCKVAQTIGQSLDALKIELGVHVMIAL
jgi:alkylation response protein AidB-like acyl-CoA dehydrogenase